MAKIWLPGDDPILKASIGWPLDPLASPLKNGNWTIDWSKLPSGCIELIVIDDAGVHNIRASYDWDRAQGSSPATNHGPSGGVNGSAYVSEGPAGSSTNTTHRELRATFSATSGFYTGNVRDRTILVAGGIPHLGHGNPGSSSLANRGWYFLPTSFRARSSGTDRTVSYPTARCIAAKKTVGSAFRVWSDGIYRGTTSSGSTVFDNTSCPYVQIGNTYKLTDTTWVYNRVAEVSLIMVFDSGLPNNEIERLTANPYACIVPSVGVGFLGADSSGDFTGTGTNGTAAVTGQTGTGSFTSPAASVNVVTPHQGALALSQRQPELLIPWHRPNSNVQPKNIFRFLADFRDTALDRANLKKGTTVGNTSFRPTGLYRTGNTNTGAYVEYDNSQRVWGKGEYTFFALVDMLEAAPTGGSDHDLIAEKSYTSASEPYYVMQIKRARSSAGSAFQAQWNNGGTRRTLSLSTAAGIGRYAIVLSIKSGVQYLRIYKDGVLFDSGTNNQTGTVTNYNTKFWLSRSVNSFTGYQNKIYEIVGVDPYAWSEGQADLFGEDPYGFTFDHDDPSAHTFDVAASASSFTGTGTAGTASVVGRAGTVKTDFSPASPDKYNELELDGWAGTGVFDFEGQGTNESVAVTGHAGTGVFDTVVNFSGTGSSGSVAVTGRSGTVLCDFIDVGTQEVVSVTEYGGTLSLAFIGEGSYEDGGGVGHSGTLLTDYLGGNGINCTVAGTGQVGTIAIDFTGTGSQDVVAVTGHAGTGTFDFVGAGDQDVVAVTGHAGTGVFGTVVDFTGTGVQGVVAVTGQAGAIALGFSGSGDEDVVAGTGQDGSVVADFIGTGQAGTAAVTGQTGTFSSSFVGTGVQDVVAVTGRAGAFTYGWSDTGVNEVCACTGYAGTITTSSSSSFIGTGVNGTAALTGRAGTLLTDFNGDNGTQGTAAVTGRAGDASLGVTGSGFAESAALTGQAGSFLADAILSGSAGAVAVTGRQGSLSLGSGFTDGSAGAVAVSGQSGDVSLGFSDAGDEDVIAVTGYAGTITTSSSVPFTGVGEAGAAAVTGRQGTVAADFIAAGVAGTAAVAGHAGTLTTSTSVSFVGEGAAESITVTGHAGQIATGLGFSGEGQNGNLAVTGFSGTLITDQFLEGNEQIASCVGASGQFNPGEAGGIDEIYRYTNENTVYRRDLFSEASRKTIDSIVVRHGYQFSIVKRRFNDDTI